MTLLDRLGESIDLDISTRAIEFLVNHLVWSGALSIGGLGNSRAWSLYLLSMILVTNVLVALTGQCLTTDKSGLAKFVF